MSKTKSFFKKCLSLIMALMLFVTSIPFTAVTALAATETLSSDRHGILVNGDTSRWSNNQYNIVNDQQQDNTTAAVLHFDLSSYKNKKITDATFSVYIDKTSGDEDFDYVHYYYSTSIYNDSGYLTTGGKESKNLNIGGYGAGTSGRDALLNHLQVSSSNLLARTARTSKEGSFKVADTIKKIVDQGYKDLYITIVLDKAGTSGGSGTGWSDTKINPANVNFSISYENYDFNSTAGNKEYIDANINNWNMPTTQSVKYNNYNVEINSNVLYSSNTFSDGTDKIFALNAKPQDTNMSSRASAVVNRIVYFYTQAGDEKKVKIPILAEANKVGGVMQAYQINYIALESNNWTFDKTNWYATTNKNTWDDANTSGTNGSYVVSTSTSNNVTDFADQNKNNPKPCEGQFTWRNIVSYNGSVSWNNGYMKITNPTLKMSFDGWGKWGRYARDYGAWNNLENTGISLPDNASYYLIDFSTMKDMYSKVKNDYNTIKANEDKYTADSLLNYYKGVQQIVAYNALAYDFSTDASVQQCASDMQTAINAYNTAYAGLVEVPREHTVTFRHNNGKTTERVVSAGATIGAFPANTVTTSLGNGMHNVYTWNTTLTADSTLSEDVTISESATPDFCDKNTPATCSKGIICSVCGGEYGNVDPNAHSFTNYVYDGNATCTENGTKTATCVLCNNATDTIADPSHPATGHNYDADPNSKKFVCRNDASHIKMDGNKQIDLSAYYSKVALANSKLENTAKYTKDSLKALQAELDKAENKLAPATDTQSTVDAKANAIGTKITELKLETYTVKYYVVENGVQKEEPQSFDRVYGDVLTFKLDSNKYPNYVVEKWVRTDSKKNDHNIISSSNMISYTVDDSSSIYVHIKSVASTTEENKSTIFLKSKIGKTVGSIYVTTGQPYIVTISGANVTIDGQLMTAPQYSFYNVVGFKIGNEILKNGQEITVTENTTIVPIYEAKENNNFTITATGCTINGVKGSYNARWDEKVLVTNPNATAWKVNGNIVAYGTSYEFRATSSVNITYDTAQVVESAIANVNYLTYDGYRNKTITAVGSFKVPEGATLTRTGVILKTSKTSLDAVQNLDSYKITNAGGVFTANNIVKDTNQFTINVYASYDYQQLYVGAVAYVVYQDSTGEHVTYSDQVTTYSFVKSNA